MCTMTFEFISTIDMSEIASTLQLSCIAVESLFGALRVQLQTSYQFLPQQRRVVVDMTQQPGQALALVFLGYVTKEFGVNVIRLMRREGRC